MPWDFFPLALFFLYICEVLGDWQELSIVFMALAASDITLVSQHSICKDIFIHTFILVLLLSITVV